MRVIHRALLYQGFYGILPGIGFIYFSVALLDDFLKYFLSLQSMATDQKHDDLFNEEPPVKHARLRRFNPKYCNQNDFIVTMK